MSDLPGTIYLNRSRWWWRVHLPGTTKRKAYPLRAPQEKHALAESRGRDVAEAVAWRMWEEANRASLKRGGAPTITLGDVCDKFLSWAHTYYRRSDGAETGEAYNCEVGLRQLRADHGKKPIADLVYHDVLSSRDALIAQGLVRTTVNQRVGIWKRLVAWALENRYCPAQVKSEVWAITALKRHRTEAPEGKGTTPVEHRIVKKTVKQLPAHLATMVRVHELCGARPIEMCLMRPMDIDTRRDVWVYRPQRHKSEHTGRTRAICLGPRAQKILGEMLSRVPAEEYLFKPYGGCPPGSHKIHEHYTKDSYAQAIGVAAKKAKTSHWTPNQLRHACGTRVRRKFAAEAARVVLGHASRTSRITDRYTKKAIEREEIRLSSSIMRQIG